MSKVTSENPAHLAAQFVNYTSKNIFLTGKAGTGKTTFLRSIVQLTHKRSVIVAPTGIAAINAGGTTIHSLLQIPFGTFLPKEPTNNPENHHFNTPKSIMRHLRMNSIKRRVILDLDLLIIDEVSMLRADLLDAIDMMLRYVRKNNAPFGGVQVLFIGDLHQLPPVVKNEEWKLLSEFYQSAYFFDALVLKNEKPVYIELEHIYRQADPVFINLLNNLRNNQVQKEDMALLKTYYQANYTPKLSDHYITLTTHNNKADTLNKDFLKSLKTKSFIYTAKVEKEFSESAFPADQHIELKVGAQIMFIKNDPTGQQRFFNGKIATVIALDKDEIKVETEAPKMRIVLEKNVWKNIKYNTDPATKEITEETAGTFTQYPIKLAWAITVHKSQGLTFDKAIIDIGNAFAPGQIYVALSRLRSLDGLILTSLISDKGIRQDHNVFEFNKTKSEQEDLNIRIKNESDLFLKNFLLDSFNLKTLDNYLFEHVFTYTKEESRSIKQTHHNWALQMQEELSAIKINADKFLKQIQSLYQSNDPEEALKNILMRVEAAEKYFNPLLAKFSLSIFNRIEIVKAEHHVKAFLEELMELEAMFYQQYRNIKKATELLKHTIHQTSFTKADAQKLFNDEERAALIAKALNHDELAEDSFRPIKKSKKTKEPKEDTKEITFNLMRQGKSIAEIATERNLVQGTIEGHLAYYVAKGQLNAKKIMPLEKLDAILLAIKELKTVSSAQLREHLGGTYTYGEIKIAMAAHLAENE
ncbi:MAG: helix-turn-helix domain-containing protein [Sphingobacteriaceae bacterium]|nr:helix-turn-helix domain-containing protein [Sphingobacteriaceae bacterium]